MRLVSLGLIQQRDLHLVTAHLVLSLLALADANQASQVTRYVVHLFVAEHSHWMCTATTKPATTRCSSSLGMDVASFHLLACLRVPLCMQANCILHHSIHLLACVCLCCMQASCMLHHSIDLLACVCSWCMQASWMCTARSHPAAAAVDPQRRGNDVSHSAPCDKVIG
jgi:hypothetical protein